MKLGEIFRFEVGYQARRPWTWAYFLALLALAFQMTAEAYTENARAGGYFFNAPFVVAAVTVFGSLAGLLVAAALAGDAAARDVQTRMHPLVYTSPVGEGTYLGGRFLAAFALNAGVMLSVQIGLLLTLTLRIPADLMGPFRPGAYLGAYLVVALPNAFVATALLFALAALTRRSIAGYLGAVLLFFATMLAWLLLAGRFGRWELAKLVDPLGLTVLAEISRTTTPQEKNALAVAEVGAMLRNRAVWIGVALGVLALARLRFRFDARATGAPRGVRDADPVAPRGEPIAVPRVPRTFGAAGRARQTLSVAGESFRQVALSWGGLVLATLSAILVVFGPGAMEHIGVPLVPTTRQMIDWVGHTGEILWTIVPLLTAFYVGELVWRERETGLSEIADAAPVPEWVRLVGRFLGIAGVLAAYQALLVAACMLIQAQLGYYHFQPELYARVLFGLLLPEHLLFAALALAVHVLVNHKYAGHMVLVAAYALTLFAPALGVEHDLLVYGAAPAWTYSDIRGFGPSVAPWAWLKAYWAAWALLLGVAARLFWVRGREQGPAARLRLARRRLTRPALGAAVVGAGLVVGLGGFVFYNTHVLNAYETSDGRAARRAEYERRYGRYEGIPQPRLAAARLRVEIHPRRREAEVRGVYTLVNTTGAAIDTLHLATVRDVETGPAEFDRPAALALDDPDLGHRVYALRAPLLPGDSLRLGFRVRFRPRGFTREGVDPSVAANGTFFEGDDWLPAVGYQPRRELSGAGERSEHGLPPRPEIRPLDDAAARHDPAGAGRIALDVVVGTDAGQVAVAPGALRRAWTENGRRYFHYATDAPISNDFAIYSAAYAVRDARWRDVSIQVVHHPGHPWNADRMIRSVQASLDYYTRHFGPYPHRQVRLVEQPGDGNSLHAAPVNVSYEEGFALFRPDADSRRLDFPFAVVAHEIAHYWWGHQVTPAEVEGGALLSESLAWYSAMAVVRETYGDEHLARLLDLMREIYLSPRQRAAPPLLRARDWFHAYRKGPFAMHALREYVGEARVNAALRRLVERHRSGAPPLPTSLDLYRELRAVTPDSLGWLLHDLFEANTYWELETEAVRAVPAAGGAWRVTLAVRARKTVVDTLGMETEVPMDDAVEIGVYAAAEGGGPGAPLYLRRHRVRSGAQRITVTVPREPARAGIDPRNLLIDVEPGDNVAEVGRTGKRNDSRAEDR